MLMLKDGRFELWQWDTGRILSVDGDCSQAHFSDNITVEVRYGRK